MKFAHRFHSLKVIFENNTNIRVTHMLISSKHQSSANTYNITNAVVKTKVTPDTFKGTF